jgi:hypothetical protein
LTADVKCDLEFELYNRDFTRFYMFFHYFFMLTCRIPINSVALKRNGVFFSHSVFFEYLWWICVILYIEKKLLRKNQTLTVIFSQTYCTHTWTTRITRCRWQMTCSFKRSRYFYNLYKPKVVYISVDTPYDTPYILCLEATSGRPRVMRSESIEIWISMRECNDIFSFFLMVF